MDDSRSAILRSAKNIFKSLWSVNDATTTFIQFTYFYVTVTLENLAKIVMVVLGFFLMIMVFCLFEYMLDIGSHQEI